MPAPSPRRSRFRLDPDLYLALQQIEDDEPLDPSLRGGVVPVDWRIQRLLGVTCLDAALRFVDIVAPESRAYLTAALAPLLKVLHISDLDLSAVTNKELRSFTQEIARYVIAGPVFGEQVKHAPEMDDS